MIKNDMCVSEMPSIRVNAKIVMMKQRLEESTRAN